MRIYLLMHIGIVFICISFVITSSAEHSPDIPIASLHCKDSLCSTYTKTEQQEKDFSYITTHRQKTSQLEIYIQYSGADISLPEKMELIVNDGMVNITQVTRNQWLGITDVALKGCSYYYLNIYNGNRVIRHPSYGLIKTDGVGSCVGTPPSLSYEKEGSLSFSLMLYVVLILCCVLI